jgi:hypothetical protein
VTIHTQLSVEPASLTTATRDQLRLTLTAKNVGMEIVDPQLRSAQLTVNGRRSRAFSLAVGNGRRENKWYALVPGDSVSMTWSSLGESLFPEPGEYTLVLSHDGREAEPVVVSVAP